MLVNYKFMDKLVQTAGLPSTQITEPNSACLPACVFLPGCCLGIFQLAGSHNKFTLCILTVFFMLVPAACLCQYRHTNTHTKKSLFALNMYHCTIATPTFVVLTSRVPNANLPEPSCSLFA